MDRREHLPQHFGGRRDGRALRRSRSRKQRRSRKPHRRNFGGEVPAASETGRRLPPVYPEKPPPSIPTPTALTTNSAKNRVRAKAARERVQASAGASADDRTRAHGAGPTDHADRKAGTDCNEFQTTRKR